MDSWRTQSAKMNLKNSLKIMDKQLKNQMKTMDIQLKWISKNNA